MAVVYRAQDIMLERPVAIKLLRQDYSNNEPFREQFRREARSAANLSHPNIVTVHDFGFDAGRLFIVMEFIDGEDLKNIIRSKKQFGVPEAIHLITQACAGLGYAHRAGIVHCDVKPHNMLVTADQRLKMTDFGIARALSSIDPNEKNEEVWGSPQYFSPEQAAGKAPSPASDVYSLGVVLYEMLTGQLPFSSPDAGELARLHREAKPVPPRRFNPDIPAELEQIILKVLSKEPTQRYRSADQLGRLLVAFDPQSATYHIPLPQSEQNQPTAEHAQTQPFKSAPRSRRAEPPVQSTFPSAILAAAKPAPKFNLANILSMDIILLGVLALFLVVGLVPFGLYVLLRFW